jgi:integrase
MVETARSQDILVGAPAPLPLGMSSLAFVKDQGSVRATQRIMAWSPPEQLAPKPLLDYFMSEDDRDRMALVKASVVVDKTFGNAGATLKRFFDFCQQRRIPAELIIPPSRGLIFWYLASEQGLFKAKTIRTRISHLKLYCSTHSIPWVAGELTDYEAQSFFKGLANLEPASDRAVRRPFLVPDQLAVERFLDHNNHFDVAVKALMRFARAGLCRLGEVTVESRASFDPSKHVKLSDVSLLEDQADGLFLKVHLPWDKTHKAKGRDVLVPEEHPDIDPIACLLMEHVVKNHVNPDEHLFSYFDRNGVRRPMTHDGFVNRVNECLAAAGLERIQGHGFRAGGATQLLLWGVPPEVVRIRGGWVSQDCKPLARPRVRTHSSGQLFKNTGARSNRL